MISLEEVRVQLDGADCLGPLSLHLERGELAALIGPPGAGKSLVLKLIAGLLRPSAGRVCIDGSDLATLDAAGWRALRARIGVVFQNNALFDSRTILENVAFPLRRAPGVRSEEEVQRRARDCLAAVGLAGTEALYPHQLSGGMQKRAGIARAAASDPELRLYDEPSAGLDPVTSARILALITRVHQQRPGVSMVVSNELDTLLSVVPRVIMLHQGRVVFDGPRAALSAPGAPDLARRFVEGDVSAPL